jgi:iron complex outermembrane receptor protein
VAALALGVPAWAQPPAPSAEEPPATEIEEEVTVTARKFEEAIQDVPFSIAAPSEDALRAQGVDTIEGVSNVVPGLIVQNLGPGQSQVAMRGVSSGQIVRDQPGVKEQVGVYLDESAISLSLFTPDVDLFDLGRVEVLRGPQGTLFGAGSESGTVRYITNQPELGLRSAYVDFGIYSIDGGDVGGSIKVAANAPVGENAAFRIAAYHNEVAGFIDAVQPDLSVSEDVNGGTRSGVRLSLRAQPSENVSVTPRILYQEVDLDGFNRIDIYNILGNPFTTTRPKVFLDEREQFTQFEEPFTDEFLLADLTIEADLGGALLTSVSSYIDRDILQVRDATQLTASITGGSIALPEPVYTLDAPLDDATTLKQWSQELRFSGQSEKLDWVFGGFYTELEKDYGQSLIVAGFQDLTGIPTRGLRAQKDELFFSDLSYDFSQWALFGEATWHVGDRFDLTAGLRWYNFDEDRTQIFDGLFGNDNNGSSLVSQPGSTDADGVAPRLIASWALTEATRLNVQASKGFRLGGINDPLNVPLCTPQDLETFGGFDTWEDEETWNYELGTKSSILGGQGVFNAAVFYADIEDLQATVTAGSCSSRVIFNVPKARSQGFEAELSASVGDNFDYSLSATYTDSELRSTITSTSSSGAVSVVSGIQEGKRLPTVPEFQAAAAASYHWQVNSDWLATVTGSYQYVGSRFTQVGDEVPSITVNLLSFAGTIGGPLTQSTFTFDPELPSYDLLNLRFALASAKWEFAAYVNNVTDERAFLAIDRERGFRARVGYLTNQPRTFGLSTRVNLR